VDQQVPIVSFTFGIPDASALAALRKTGCILVQTVTSVDEAILAATWGMDALAVQASAAGGHSGTFTPDQVPNPTPLPELLAAVMHAVDLPTVAAGGLAAPAEVAATIHGGAQAVMVGTALLRSPESGASVAHRKALADPGRGDTVVTRAFTGRPARSLPNTFIESYDALAPVGYPALHHLTRPLRQASVAAEDPEFVNLWAGSGYRSATAQPAEVILRGLARDL
jgi:NAD(P)H-dependent flavin oxidoreductase YrpB (nitropropane dioxygenase family)